MSLASFFRAGTGRQYNIRLTLDRCCILFENKNRVEVSIMQFDDDLTLDFVTQPKNNTYQSQLMLVLDIKLTLTLNFGRNQNLTKCQCHCVPAGFSNGHTNLPSKKTLPFISTHIYILQRGKYFSLKHKKAIFSQTIAITRFNRLTPSTKPKTLSSKPSPAFSPLSDWTFSEKCCFTTWKGDRDSKGVIERDGNGRRKSKEREEKSIGAVHREAYQRANNTGYR